MKIGSLVGLGVVLVLAACGGKKDAMPGMSAEEHAKMQAGEEAGATDSAGVTQRQPVHLTPEQARALGVAYLTVRRDTLSRSIRTVGQIAAPESTITSVTPKIEGFVEHLYVNYTGQMVRSGEPLLTLYSPMLVAAEQELLTAKRLAAEVDSSSGDAARFADQMLQSARRRLAYLDISQDQIARIERTGEVTKTLTLAAPFDGVVLTKDVVEGQRVMPGMELFRLAGLGTVWVEGSVFEQDLEFVRMGSRGHFELDAYPGQHLMGRVSFVSPIVDPASRTGRVRLTAPNPGLKLRPGMYATLYFDAPVGREVVAVPLEAVIITGERNLVFVRDPDGMLVPRRVVLGARSDERVQILSGLSAGETIVASANFLVDAESRLANSGDAMPGMSGMQPAAAAPATQPPAAKAPAAKRAPEPMPPMPGMEPRP